MKLILAIDGGGSRTRCLAIDCSGQVVSESTSGPSNHLLVDRDTVRQSLANATDETLARIRVNRADVACLSAGLAGVDFDGAGADEMEELLRDLGFENLVINGDMVIAHAGALQLKPGVIALAGTGSVVLGIGANGERVKVGGWGPIFGDEGSAYRIGQMALRAAATAYDGRGPETLLVPRLLLALGLAEFPETVTRVYVDGMETREIAALSRVAYEVAQEGDEVARSLFFRAAQDLAESVEAAIRQLGLDQSKVSVSYQGSVLESCHLLRERFVETLKRNVRRVSIVSPEFEPVIGAYLLGCKSLGWQVNDIVLEKLKQRPRQDEQESLVSKEGS
ncbi:MAG TPA: BadF/BadG/BcrA/BcrD ATPase family protein [Pyrinomonadaceae bacterium]|jgi:N-acetylglucosamine kinase-like BadF-type ATPase|nr:BadF/BadG/BcrA/BcrD ATPase family protein [Pyrinomonadaceae bacterium]